MVVYICRNWSIIWPNMSLTQWKHLPWIGRVTLTIRQPWCAWHVRSWKNIELHNYCWFPKLKWSYKCYINLKIGFLSDPKFCIESKKWLDASLRSLLGGLLLGMLGKLPEWRAVRKQVVPLQTLQSSPGSVLTIQTGAKIDKNKQKVGLCPPKLNIQR